MSHLPTDYTIHPEFCQEAKSPKISRSGPMCAITSAHVGKSQAGYIRAGLGIISTALGWAGRRTAPRTDGFAHGICTRSDSRNPRPGALFRPSLKGTPMATEEFILNQLMSGDYSASKVRVEHDEDEKLGGSSPDHTTVSVVRYATRITADILIQANIKVPSGYWLVAPAGELHLMGRGIDPADPVRVQGVIEDDVEALFPAICKAVRDELEDDDASDFANMQTLANVHYVRLCADSRGAFLVVKLDIEAE